MPFYFPSTAFYNSPLISNSNTQLFKPKFSPVTSVNVVHQPNPWNTNSDLFLNPNTYSYFYSSNVMPSLSSEYQNQNILKKERAKIPEPTTKPSSSKRYKNQLINSPNTLRSDIGLISAVRKVNPTFEIENIVAFPGTPYYQIESVEKFSQKNIPSSKKLRPKPSNEGLSNIKVEATGRTSTGKSPSEIPLGSYFLPYNSNVDSRGKKTTTLILQPMSKAIVGNGGTAISAPISRAVLKKGVPTDVFFNPESVAIAGVGGKAHAQADLILDVMDKRLGRVNSNGEVVSFPYYGALKGHSLNVAKDDKINTVVVLNPKYAEGRGTSDTYFNKIQDSAARLVSIQEKAKQKGSFSDEDNKSYADSLFELGLAAQGLAQLQQSGEIKDFSKLLQGSSTQITPQPAIDNPLAQVGEVPNQTGDNMFVPITQDEPYDDSGESILVNAPKKDASVAEAKPVGLSIVGEGGVASSKPNAVAISGREGLAVASPKATAIAGVSPEEAAAFSVTVPTRNEIIIKAQQRANVSGSTTTIENKSPNDKNIEKRENEAQKSQLQGRDESGINILVVEPKLGDRLGLQEKQQSSYIKEVQPKNLKNLYNPAGFDESKYVNSMAYRNYLLSSVYSL